MKSKKKLQWVMVFFFLLFSPIHVYADDADHRGWNVGGAGVLHTFYFDTDDDNNRNPPSRLGGGVNLFGGYRFQKWETRLNLNLADVQVEEKKSPDFLVGLSFEPIYHFRRHPERWDPYIVLSEIGLLYLARNTAAGFSVVFPGVGFQVRLNEKWSLYTSFKLRWGVMVAGAGPRGVTVDGEFPLGVLFRF